MSDNMNSGLLTTTMSPCSLTITDSPQFTTIASGELVRRTASGKLTLPGPDADIEINGVSLKHTLLGIQQRLALLQPNPELEAEWHQLRALGEQYRALEAQLLQKQHTWNTIKQ